MCVYIYIYVTTHTFIHIYVHSVTEYRHLQDENPVDHTHLADVCTRAAESNVNGCELVLEEAHCYILSVLQQCALVACKLYVF
jgi:hypothetical protein